MSSCPKPSQNKLNFKKIDSFHGTGAFNVTIFPEWDSLLLELANQDPETVIIEVKQKRSHRGWGHQASYVNTISNNANIAPRTSHFTAPPHCSRGIAGNYLANLNTKRSSPSTLTPGQKTPKPTSQASGLSRSYLEALSQQHIPNTEVHKRLRPKRKTGRKTRKEREMIHRQTGLEQEKEQTSALSRPRLGVKSGYLETLLSNAIESTFTEPPTERKENPYLEEVRS